MFFLYNSKSNQQKLKNMLFKNNKITIKIKHERREKMNTDKIYAEQIANEYTKKTTSKVLAIKKLDRKVKLPVNIFAYTFGIIMSLVLGLGMCLSMNVVGNGLMTLGVIIGIIGFIGVGLNYPLYKKNLEKKKKKYSYDIIKLANEVLKENK